MLPFHQKTVFVPEARAEGMKLSSTNGFTPAARTAS